MELLIRIYVLKNNVQIGQNVFKICEDWNMCLKKYWDDWNKCVYKDCEDWNISVHKNVNIGINVWEKNISIEKLYLINICYPKLTHIQQKPT